MTLATTAVGRPPFDVGLVPDHRQSSTATQRSAFYVRSGLDLTPLIDPLLVNRFSLWWFQFSIDISFHQQLLKQPLDLIVCSPPVTVCVLCRERRVSPLYLEISVSISSSALVSQSLTEPIPFGTCNDIIPVLQTQQIELHNNNASHLISSLKRKTHCFRDIAPIRCHTQDTRLYVYTGVKNRQLCFSQQRKFPATTDAFPLCYLDTVSSQVLKPVPVEDIYVLSLPLEPNRHCYKNATALPLRYLKRLEFIRLTTWPSVTLLLSPYEHNFSSSCRLYCHLHHPQLSLTLLDDNSQAPLSTESIEVNPELISETHDSAQHHWYEELGLLGTIVCGDFDDGFSSLQGLVASLDSIIRLIALLVGILFGSYLFCGWMGFRLDLHLGGLTSQVHLTLVVHRIDLTRACVVEALCVFKMTSLSDEYSCIRESPISLLLMHSMVNPERVRIIRRYIASLENAILNRTVQKRAIVLDSLRLPLILGSLECLLHLNLRKTGCISLDTPSFPLLLEALSCLYVYLLNALLSSLLNFIDVIFILCTP